MIKKLKFDDIKRGDILINTYDDNNLEIIVDHINIDKCYLVYQDVEHLYISLIDNKHYVEQFLIRKVKK